MKRARAAAARERLADAWTAANAYRAALWSDLATAVHRLGAADRRHLDARAGWTEVEEAGALLALARVLDEAESTAVTPIELAILAAIGKGVERSRKQMGADGSGWPDGNKLQDGHIKEIVRACRAKR